MNQDGDDYEDLLEEWWDHIAVAIPNSDDEPRTARAIFVLLPEPRLPFPQLKRILGNMSDAELVEILCAGGFRMGDTDWLYYRWLDR